MELKTKIEELNKALLETGVQTKLIEMLRENEFKAFSSLKCGESENPQELVALWIYRDVLAPLGW